ncbi:hypothetical protein [Streptomyces sp. NPDC001194]|uniref:hypothetical protein n=1 Tax=Streptomyces sp. NPDC001194 TaxID=3364547 RepID=UPI0036D10A23
MVLEFPDDPAAAALDRQYMLGDDLLVAPVFTDDGTVEYYVPEGTWTNVLTGARITCPRRVREQHGFRTLPLLARPDSVIPLAADDQRPVSAWADGVEPRVHAFADGAERTVVIPRSDGPATWPASTCAAAATASMRPPTALIRGSSGSAGRTEPSTPGPPAPWRPTSPTRPERGGPSRAA